MPSRQDWLMHSRIGVCVALFSAVLPLSVVPAAPVSGLQRDAFDARVRVQDDVYLAVNG
jgi:hypothetical protein